MKYFTAILLSLSIAFTACTQNSVQKNPSDATQSTINSKSQEKVGHLYLYAEKHGEPWVLKKEADIWNSLYHDKGLRHLFVELPYYSAEYLNLWMHSDNDDILEQLYNDWNGTNLHSKPILDFYKRIKAECPETVFHGIDVGHQFLTTGKRFLNDMKNRYDENSEIFQRTKECINQGQYYYNNKGKDPNYRDNMMTENFIHEYSLLNGADIMGIFGGAHIRMNTSALNQPNMAIQLKNRYGDALNTNFVSSFLGNQDLSSIFPEYKYREFHRLENAYKDFKDYPKSGDILPYDNYPDGTQIQKGDVFLIEYMRKDGTIKKRFYIADGAFYNGNPATEEILIP